MKKENEFTLDGQMIFEIINDIDDDNIEDIVLKDLSDFDKFLDCSNNGERICIHHINGVSKQDYFRNLTTIPMRINQ